jgi:hypothetical protein
VQYVVCVGRSRVKREYAPIDNQPVPHKGMRGRGFVSDVSFGILGFELVKQACIKIQLRAEYIVRNTIHTQIRRYANYMHTSLSQTCV